MDTNLALQLTTMSAASTQQSVIISLMLQQQTQDKQVVGLLDQSATLAAQAPAPQGQGLLVDKTA
jgi:hypothetical protein